MCAHETGRPTTCATARVSAATSVRSSAAREACRFNIVTKTGQLRSVGRRSVLRILITRNGTKAHPRLASWRVESTACGISKQLRKVVRHRVAIIHDQLNSDNRHAS